MNRQSIFQNIIRAAALAALVIAASSGVFAQKKKPRKPAVTGPKITVLDIVGLKKTITPNGKPLLVNFWATWCDPCREEFPDLVKIDTAYKDKIDFVTISLDDLAEIKRDVPKFLTEMNAKMPAFLLHATDEDAAIKLVADDWSGSLPMTVLFDAKGGKTYIRMGKIKPAFLTAEIDKLLTPATATTTP